MFAGPAEKPWALPAAAESPPNRQALLSQTGPCQALGRAPHASGVPPRQADPCGSRPFLQCTQGQGPAAQSPSPDPGVRRAEPERRRDVNGATELP